MRQYLYPILSLILWASISLVSAHGQGITINQSDIEAYFLAGKEIQNFTDSVERTYDIGIKGGPNNWDFSEVEDQFTFTQLNVDPNETPYLDSFPDAQFCQFIEFEAMIDTLSISAQTFIYYLFENNQGLSLGSGGTSSGFGFSTTTFSKNIPPEVFAAFPIQLNQEWSYEGIEVDLTVVDSFVLGDTTTIIETTVVDAYGTMKLPDGSTKDALRFNIIRTSYGQPLFPGFPVDTFVDKSFTFISTDGSAVSVSSLGDPSQVPDEGEVTQALATVTIPSSASSVQETGQLIPGLTLATPFPNPSSGDIQVQYELLESTFLNLRVIDLQGRELARLFEGRQNPGEHNLLFNTGRLAPGQYYIQLRANGKSAAQAFRVAR